MMNILFSFSTLEGDGLPTRICDSCHLALSAAYQLKELAEKSFRTLSAHLSTQLITGDRGVKVESGEPDAEDEDFILLQVGNQSPAPEEKVGSPPAPARLACPQCPKSFSSRSARYKHVSVHHLGKRYFCPICNKSYKNGYEHRRLAHSGTASRYPCTACGKTFPSPAKLRHHSLVHSALRPFPCPICPKGFRSRAECDYHRRGVHEKEKKFLCTFCPKGFFFIQNLKVHIRSHTKEKPFSCSHCGKLFTTLSQLSTHEQRHSGLKPVCCQVCGKDFVNTGALKMHILSHTQLREHTCRFCADTFLRLDHCRRHERTKHPHSLFSTSLPIES